MKNWTGSAIPGTDVITISTTFSFNPLSLHDSKRRHNAQMDKGMLIANHTIKIS